VLVHCAAGVSRSASVVIAYVMRRHRIPFAAARARVKAARRAINPNLGFALQLRMMDRSGAWDALFPTPPPHLPHTSPTPPCRMMDRPGAWDALFPTAPRGHEEALGSSTAAAAVGAGAGAAGGAGGIWPPPWDLDSFLDAREACGPDGADDRTLQVRLPGGARRGGEEWPQRSLGSLMAIMDRAGCRC
jgi:hypothetical protein